MCECRLDIDLFASGVNHKLPWFATWTAEEGAEIVDIFTVVWQNFIPFLNPPFSLWSGVLLQVAGRQERQDKTRQALLWALPPCSPNQPWFSVMLRMLVKVPILMPRNTAKLMKLPWDKNLVHPMAKNHGQESKVCFGPFVREVPVSQVILQH